MTLKPITYFIALTSALTLLTSMPNYALDLDGARTKDLIPIQRPLAILEPSQRPSKKTGVTQLEVTAWVDKENAIYHLGETVKFYVKVNKDAYATLLDIGTTGKTHIIFPNQFQKSNLIKAGQVVKIPRDEDNFVIKVGGNKGREVIKVIATQRNVSIIPEHYTTAAGPYRNIAKDLEVVASDIGTLLNNVDYPEEWDEYTKVLTIK